METSAAISSYLWCHRNRRWPSSCCPRRRLWRRGWVGGRSPAANILRIEKGVLRRHVLVQGGSFRHIFCWFVYPRLPGCFANFARLAVPQAESGWRARLTILSTKESLQCDEPPCNRLSFHPYNRRSLGPLPSCPHVKHCRTSCCHHSKSRTVVASSCSMMPISAAKTIAAANISPKIAPAITVGARITHFSLSHLLLLKFCPPLTGSKALGQRV